jgi:flagellar motor switch protein FliN/FliY
MANENVQPEESSEHPIEGLSDLLTPLSLSPSGTDGENASLIMDLSLPVSVELGRTNMLIKDLMVLSPGAVIELDKLVGEPVDLIVNDKKLAEGEVVVIDENFAVRITSITNTVAGPKRRR